MNDLSCTKAYIAHLGTFSMLPSLMYPREEIFDAGIYEPPPLPIIPLLPNCVHEDLVATDVYVVSIFFLFW